MIIQNGFLFTYDTTGGGMLHGIPQKVETKLSDKGIPCNIVKNKSDHQGTYQDGKFKQFAAKVLIEPQDFTAKRVKLTDNRGVDLGEFEVQDITYLEAVEALQITI